ncbi:unnamed protein product, partial [Closterium sp. NIES-53]
MPLSKTSSRPSVGRKGRQRWETKNLLKERNEVRPSPCSDSRTSRVTSARVLSTSRSSNSRVLSTSSSSNSRVPSTSSSSNARLHSTSSSTSSRVLSTSSSANARILSTSSSSNARLHSTSSCTSSTRSVTPGAPLRRVQRRLYHSRIWTREGSSRRGGEALVPVPVVRLAPEVPLLRLQY